MKKLILGLIVIIVVLAVVFLLFRNNNKIGNLSIVKPTPTQTVINPATNDNQVISETIDYFYKKYENCMKNPPKEAEGRVGEYCQGNTGQTSQKFIANLEEGGTAKAGADPIVCAQDFPESIVVDSDVEIEENIAIGHVDEKFGPSQIKPEIELVYVNGVWEINNIICP